MSLWSLPLSLVRALLIKPSSRVQVLSVETSEEDDVPKAAAQKLQQQAKEAALKAMEPETGKPHAVHSSTHTPPPSRTL